MLIVLTGIDGSGKSTAARALVAAARDEGRNALLLSNHAGRQNMSVLGERLGIRWPHRLADAVETTFRVANVLVSHARARRFDGLVVMDRHLHCQLALRTAKGLPRGRLIPWLISSLPTPDAVVHLDVEPALAHQRIVARGTDTETMAHLVALRDAYRSMPEYPGFIQLDADCPPADVVDRLARIVHAEGFAASHKENPSIRQKQSIGQM
ncbi:dTMP kinase [Arthrobacter cavernae]|uniref:Thymidylate kinase n=1 Tax=Arthrobacter cavernae TaxID=2817681 RepID=A0A939KJ28_9MICC|nr:AAA family ATPase [Arthrobacter cavernae]MBO1268227.1 AAA family ATPase [Arthrobacter cavernae]